jgi:uncharacterized protein (DUF1499 family)
LARFFFCPEYVALMSFLDFTALRRPKSPNSCLVAPQDLTTRARVDRAAPEFNVAPDELWIRLEDYVSTQSPARSIETDAATRRLRYVAVTPLLRFKDDIDIQVLDVAGDPTKSTIAIYSRSRIGHSDLGTNARRVDRLLAALR